jgi:hypothetical protein
LWIVKKKGIPFLIKSVLRNIGVCRSFYNAACVDIGVIVQMADKAFEES